jgi:heme exporter protein C
VLYGTHLRALSIATLVTMTAALGLAFFYAPMDADQGFMQKIFYVHVPMAMVALGGFVFGGIMAIQHLRTGDPKHDLRSYVAIHLSLILGVGVLVTGAIWAKASWGHWWVWDEPTLVSFLIVFLLYATYQPMRFSIEDRERQARYASVFAIVAGAFVPLNFLAVRLAQAYTHPRVFATADGGAVRDALALRDGLQAHLGPAPRAAPQALGRRRRHARRPDGGAEPAHHVTLVLAQATTDALPDNVGYVAAAYLVFFALVLVYVVIMASKLARFERELAELNDLADERRGGLAGAREREPEEAGTR